MVMGKIKRKKKSNEGTISWLSLSWARPFFSSSSLYSPKQDDIYRLGEYLDSDIFQVTTFKVPFFRVTFFSFSFSLSSPLPSLFPYRTSFDIPSARASS